MINQLQNCKNQYQTKTKRVLCVCSAGLLRSPTAANVLHEQYGFNTRACGADEHHALVPLSPVLIHWADEIVCMDVYQEQSIQDMMQRYDKEFARLGIKFGKTPIRMLNVPDMFEYTNPKLQSMIRESYEEDVLNEQTTTQE